MHVAVGSSNTRDLTVIDGVRGGPVLCSKGGWYDSLLGNVRRFKRSNSGGKGYGREHANKIRIAVWHS